jgi:hypothetical protein
VSEGVSVMKDLVSNIEQAAAQGKSISLKVGGKAPLCAGGCNFRHEQAGGEAG